MKEKKSAQLIEILKAQAEMLIFRCFQKKNI